MHFETRTFLSSAAGLKLFASGEYIAALLPNNGAKELSSATCALSILRRVKIEIMSVYVAVLAGAREGTKVESNPRGKSTIFRVVNLNC